MYCTKCGYQLNKDAKFCSKCGEKVKNDPMEKTTASPKQVGNDSTKTGSIILGVISILTCCTCFVPIILGIVGIMLAIKARKEDPTFKAGLILNIIGIVLVVIMILTIIGFVIIGVNIEGKLTYDWCCSNTSDTSKCTVQLELDDDYTYELKNNYETFEANGNWDYNWMATTKLKGDQYTLTLDEYDYTVYLKGSSMKIYDDKKSTMPIMYCTKR